MNIKINKPESIEDSDSLGIEELQISEIVNWRKFEVSEIIAKTEDALYIKPLRGQKEWFAKSILRINHKGELWLEKWKFQQIYGKNS